MRDLEIFQSNIKGYQIEMKGLFFRTNSKQYPDLVMPIEKEIRPRIVISYDKQLTNVTLSNLRIIFINRVIKELQYFIKEVTALKNLFSLTLSVNLSIWNKTYSAFKIASIAKSLSSSCAVFSFFSKETSSEKLISLLIPESIW